MRTPENKDFRQGAPVEENIPQTDALPLRQKRSATKAVKYTA